MPGTRIALRLRTRQGSHHELRMRALAPAEMKAMVGNGSAEAACR